MAKILLIDDEAYTRELYDELLRDEGYEVVTATNGEEALTEAAKGGFDLILLDIIMPKKDGLAFLKDYDTIRPQNPNAQIVMLTVLSEDPIIKSCLEIGASGYLIKSELTPDKLVEEVKGYLVKSSPQG